MPNFEILTLRPTFSINMESLSASRGEQAATTTSGRLEVDDLTSTPGSGASPGLQSTIQMQLARSLFTPLLCSFKLLLCAFRPGV